MRKKDLIWLALFGLAALLTAAVKYLPFLPGDVIRTRLVQSLLPESKEWAKWLSSTAEMPAVLISDKHYVPYFHGGGRMAGSFAVDGQLHGIAVAGESTGTDYRPTASISRISSRCSVAIRLGLSIHLCSKLYINGWIPGCSGNSQNIGKASLGYIACLLFAPYHRMDCQGCPCGSLAKRCGDILSHRAFVGYLAHPFCLRKRKVLSS